MAANRWNRNEQVRSHDGRHFDAHLALPASGSGPGLLLLQEIFGVNDYIGEAAGRLTGLGYVVLAPDVFWRQEAGVAIDEYNEQQLGRAFALMQGLDVPAAVGDCAAAFDHLRALPEVTGGAGLFGFCMGGWLAFFTAAESSPDVLVSYYGSAIPDNLDKADRVRCPALFHFGGADPYIPKEKLDRVREALGSRPGVEIHVHEGAGHAFDNHQAAMFHHPRAKADAWPLTVDFLRRTLPVEVVEPAG